MSDLRSYVNTLYKIVDEPVDNIHFVIYKDCTVKDTYFIGIHKLKYKKSFGEIIVSEENLRKLAESQTDDFIKCNCLSELLLWFYFDDFVELHIYRNYQGKVKGCLDSICFDKNTWKLIQTKIPDVHTNSRHGCTFCSPTSKLNTEQFVEKAKIIHGDDYDYSLVEYKNSNTKVKIKCNTCKKIFEQRPHDHLKGCGCFCVYKGEIEIENYLKENNISFEKTKKYSNLKDKSLLSYDFYIPLKNLLIEYNGEQHYKNKFKKPLHEWHRQLHHDWLKRKYAKDNNINLLIIPYWKFGNIKEILDKQS